MFRSRFRPLSFATLAVGALIGAPAFAALWGPAAGSLVLAGIVLAVVILLIRTAGRSMKAAE
jgi:hypothetical protein